MLPPLRTRTKYDNQAPYIMLNKSQTASQIKCVTSFQDLVGTPFCGDINVICWTRSLLGDFEEIVNKLDANENIAEIHID